jgi:hypothetical protein
MIDEKYLAELEALEGEAAGSFAVRSQEDLDEIRQESASELDNPKQQKDASRTT